MPYDKKNTETAEQLRKRIEREGAKRGGRAHREVCPTPEEIAERAAEIRAARVDEKGVLKVPPCNDNKGDGRKQREYQPGIREIANPARTRRGGQD